MGMIVGEGKIKKKKRERERGGGGGLKFFSFFKTT